jgi:hypothetical protein
VPHLARITRWLAVPVGLVAVVENLFPWYSNQSLKDGRYLAVTAVLVTAALVVPLYARPSARIAFTMDIAAAAGAAGLLAYTAHYMGESSFGYELFGIFYPSKLQWATVYAAEGGAALLLACALVAQCSDWQRLQRQDDATMRRRARISPVRAVLLQGAIAAEVVLLLGPASSETYDNIIRYRPLYGPEQTMILLDFCVVVALLLLELVQKGESLRALVLLLFAACTAIGILLLGQVLLRTGGIDPHPLTLGAFALLVALVLRGSTLVVAFRDRKARGLVSAS